MPCYGLRISTVQGDANAASGNTVITALLDTNVYDLLEPDQPIREKINELVALGTLTIIVTRTAAEELAKSPFHGIPDFFPFECTGNTVAFAGIMCAGDSLGSGNIYLEHLKYKVPESNYFESESRLSPDVNIPIPQIPSLVVLRAIWLKYAVFSWPASRMPEHARPAGLHGKVANISVPRYRNYRTTMSP